MQIGAPNSNFAASAYGQTQATPPATAAATARIPDSAPVQTDNAVRAAEGGDRSKNDTEFDRGDKRDDDQGGRSLQADSQGRGQIVDIRV